MLYRNGWNRWVRWSSWESIPRTFVVMTAWRWKAILNDCHDYFCHIYVGNKLHVTGRIKMDTMKISLLLAAKVQADRAW